MKCGIRAEPPCIRRAGHRGECEDAHRREARMLRGVLQMVLLFLDPADKPRSVEDVRAYAEYIRVRLDVEARRRRRDS